MKLNRVRKRYVVAIVRPRRRTYEIHAAVSHLLK